MTMLPSIPIALLTPQGLTEVSYTATSLAEAASKEPSGVYTVARTFDHDKALLLDDHLDRLERSAQLEGIAVKLDRSALRAALRTLIGRSGYSGDTDSRFRLTIPHAQPDHVYLSLEPFHPVPAEIITNGARVVTAHVARENPIAKTTAWMSARKATVESFPTGIYEGILVSPEGLLLEGTSSNFYAVVNGTLYTADDNRVLSGIARRLLLKVAAEILPITLTPIRETEIGSVEEALLTSAGRGVVPIIEIDGHRIGSGKPGHITQRLHEAYDSWASAHLEPI
ncbi:MAG: aminotransferase class IV [Chloroflexota bacterium]